eukprot:2986289-Pyramimonas_sp.AAC.1
MFPLTQSTTLSSLTHAGSYSQTHSYLPPGSLHSEAPSTRVSTPAEVTQPIFTHSQFMLSLAHGEDSCTQGPSH